MESVASKSSIVSEDGKPCAPHFLATTFSSQFILNAASQRSSKHIVFQHGNTGLQQVNDYPNVIYSKYMLKTV